MAFQPRIRNVGPVNPNALKNIAVSIAGKVLKSYVVDKASDLLKHSYRKLSSKLLSSPPVTMPGRAKRRVRTAPAEIKTFDVGFSNSVFAVTGIYTTLNAVVNGSEAYQRVGRKIFLRSLHIKGAINIGATAVQDVGRILVIYDRQANAALPAFADILQNSNAGLASNVLSFRNINNVDRFKMLKDYKVIQPPGSVAAGVVTNYTMTDNIYHSYNFDWTIPLKGLESTYNATNGGTIADITTGSIIIVTISGNNAGFYNLAFSSRLVYTD